MTDSLWDKQAQQWQYVGAPLRPSVSDVNQVSLWLESCTPKTNQNFNVLLLGATPELVDIAWPRNTHLHAIDSNVFMLQSLLSEKKPSCQLLKSVGNWLQLPLPDSSMDLVLGDGCYSMLSAKNYNTITQEILRILHPQGCFMMRFFVRPNHQETIDSILQDFLSHSIPNFHILKWRIAMALHGTLEEGVCLRDIWDVWHHDFSGHQEYLIWPRAVIDTINVYKDNLVIYTFPTLIEINQKLRSLFQEVTIYTPNYPLGDRCPTFKLRI